MSRFKSILVVVAFLLLPLASVVELGASSNGISGFSGNPATNGGLTCSACHARGIVPTVVMTGPTFVEPGSTNTYTLTVGGGQERAGGLDVSVTAGNLVVIDPGTYLLDGEITQVSPRPVDIITNEAVWSFNWTAPPTPGTVTMYGAGNSVNLAQAFNGDEANTDVLTIAVGGGSTPGESSGPILNPLLVTGFDTISGDLSIQYDAACETTDTNIYYGPLDQVSGLNWSGEVCGIGTGGSYSGFNPGSGSYFFVVVGNKGADEGSYGRSLSSGGSEQERDAFFGNICGQAQDLSNSCD